jgi:hypothetical protein
MVRMVALCTWCAELSAHHITRQNVVPRPMKIHYASSFHASDQHKKHTRDKTGKAACLHSTPDFRHAWPCLRARRPRAIMRAERFCRWTMCLDEYEIIQMHTQSHIHAHMLKKLENMCKVSGYTHLPACFEHKLTNVSDTH